MAGFNQKQTIKTKNRSGHAAYKMADKEKLVTQVLTTFFNEPKYYGDTSNELIETAKAMTAKEPEFVAKLAVYARREFNMRTVSHVLCAILAHEVKGEEFTRSAVNGCVVRGDDATEIMACYISMFGKPIPNSLRRGLCDALERMSPFQIAKYQERGKAVNMADLAKLCHPGNKHDVFKACIEGTLEVPTSWETELSAKGNTRETWEALIAENKIGYMAALRNLRNMINADPKNLDVILSKIADPEEVKRSRQLPFRFHTAYKQMKSVPNAGSRVLDALEDAMSASLANLPQLPGTTVIAVDVSGSMLSPISRKSTVKCDEIAALLGVAAANVSDNAILYTFDTKAYKVNVSKRSGILGQANALANKWGGGTNMEKPFEKMIEDGVRCDRVIVLSDNEVNSSGWYRKPVQQIADEYRRKTGQDVWVHAIDLQGYGTQQFHGAKTNIIAGWSEKVLEFVKLAEEGAGGLIEKIESTSV